MVNAIFIKELQTNLLVNIFTNSLHKNMKYNESFTSDILIFFLISFFRQGKSSKYFKVQNEWYHIL